jgi:hypothetical protein
MGGNSTMAEKVFSSLKLGLPLSVTRTVMWLVVPASAAVVIQEKAPLVLTITAVAGAPASRLKLSVWLVSMSLACAVNDRVCFRLAFAGGAAHCRP